MSEIFDFYLFAINSSNVICLDHYQGPLYDTSIPEEEDDDSWPAYDYFYNRFPYITADLFDEDGNDVAVISGDTDKEQIIPDDEIYGSYRGKKYDKYLLFRRRFEQNKTGDYDHYYIAGDVTCRECYSGRGEDICLDIYSGSDNMYLYDKYYDDEVDYDWYNNYSDEIHGVSVANGIYPNSGKYFPFEMKYKHLRRETYRSAYIIRIRND